MGNCHHPGRGPERHAGRLHPGARRARAHGPGQAAEARTARPEEAAGQGEGQAGNDLTTRPQLAGRINAEHQQGESAFREGLLHAKTAGELLLQAKGQCAHGAWLPWLKANVAFSERTTQAYMRIAREWDTLTAKAQHV